MTIRLSFLEPSWRNDSLVQLQPRSFVKEPTLGSVGNEDSNKPYDRWYHSTRNVVHLRASYSHQEHRSWKHRCMLTMSEPHAYHSDPSCLSTIWNSSLSCSANRLIILRLWVVRPIPRPWSPQRFGPSCLPYSLQVWYMRPSRFRRSREWQMCQLCPINLSSR